MLLRAVAVQKVEGRVTMARMHMWPAYMWPALSYEMQQGKGSRRGSFASPARGGGVIQRSFTLWS